MQGLLKQSVFVAFSIVHDLHHATALAASRAARNSKKKGAGSTSQDWDLPQLQWFFASYVSYFTLQVGLSSPLLAIPFHREQGCMNLPAQRLHTVFKPSHSLAKLFFATTVMSREQETGTEAAASHRDLDRQWKTGQQSTPVRAIVRSYFQLQFRSSYLFLTALKHVTLSMYWCLHVPMYTENRSFSNISA